MPVRINWLSTIRRARSRARLIRWTVAGLCSALTAACNSVLCRSQSVPAPAGARQPPSTECQRITCCGGRSSRHVETHCTSRRISTLSLVPLSATGRSICPDCLEGRCPRRLDRFSSYTQKSSLEPMELFTWCGQNSTRHDTTLSTGLKAARPPYGILYLRVVNGQHRSESIGRTICSGLRTPGMLLSIARVSSTSSCTPSRNEHRSLASCVCTMARPGGPPRFSRIAR
jgi:hypothetical protein